MVRFEAGDKRVYVMNGLNRMGQILESGTWVIESVERGQMIRLEPLDAYRVLQKMREVKKHKLPLPVCAACAGTPLFPGKVANVPCKDKMHPSHPA